MLQWSNVTSGYHRKPIIRNADLAVNKTEILVMVGLNGSGKSTLLKTALGLIKCENGEVLLEGRNIEAYSLTERAKKISLLESQTEVAFAMSVQELLEIAARLHAPPDRAKMMTQALAAVGLKNYSGKNVLELSSGELRRAMLAHALCTNTKIIMLDEPFAHLDWNHQHGLVESLLHWRKLYGTTFVLAVHELEWAAKIADRLCVVHQGCIIACDAPAAVFQNPVVSEVFAFRAAIDENPIDGSRRLTLGYQPRK